MDALADEWLYSILYSITLKDKGKLKPKQNTASLDSTYFLFSTKGKYSICATVFYLSTTCVRLSQLSTERLEFYKIAVVFNNFSYSFCL